MSERTPPPDIREKRLPPLSIQIDHDPEHAVTWKRTRREVLISLGTIAAVKALFDGSNAWTDMRIAAMEEERTIEANLALEKRICDICYRYGINIDDFNSPRPDSLVLCIELPREDARYGKADELLDMFLNELAREGVSIKHVLTDDTLGRRTLSTGIEAESIDDVREYLSRQEKIPGRTEYSDHGDAVCTVQVLQAQQQDVNGARLSVMTMSGHKTVGHTGFPYYIAGGMHEDITGKSAVILSVALNEDAEKNMKAMKQSTRIVQNEK